MLSGLSAPLSRATARSSQSRCAATTRLLHRRAAPTMREGMREHQVVFVRHGQSTWNKANRFIGWTDTALTEDGEVEAREAGRTLVQHKIDIDEVHTSLLQRCTHTASIILHEMHREYLPMHCHWRLNERSYGALVGKNKKECVQQHGVDQVKAWRRSYDVRPPAMDRASIYHPLNDRDKYSHLPPSLIPDAESLRDTKKRAVVYWNEVIVPAVRAGKRLLVVGHENNLRALLMHIDGISQTDIVRLEIPRAVPLLYKFDGSMRPIRQEGSAEFLSGRYLMAKEQVAAIQERDHSNVYDTSIQVNLEDLALQEALALLSHKPSGPSPSPSRRTAMPFLATNSAASGSSSSSGSSERSQVVVGMGQQRGLNVRTDPLADGTERKSEA